MAYQHAPANEQIRVIERVTKKHAESIRGLFISADLWDLLYNLKETIIGRNDYGQYVEINGVKSYYDPRLKWGWKLCTNGTQFMMEYRGILVYNLRKNNGHYPDLDSA